MAKLQPSLLDRLTNQHPEKKKETAAEQVLSQQQYKNAVIRDLGWLLNSISMETLVDLEPYPEVRHSVLNFGLMDLSGHTASTIDPEVVEKELRRVIYEFEPRIIPNTLKVLVNPDEMSHNALEFHIEAAIFEQPMPFQVTLRSRLDLENIEFQVAEDRG